MRDSRTGFNPRKCNSASTLSDCIECDLSKVIIALPTSNEVVEVFEKLLTGGFSCVNIRLSFDAELLLPNANKMLVDGYGNLYKDYNYKIPNKLKLDNNDFYENKKVKSKILKLDENNQYGFAMTKPLPTGCIKEKEVMSYKKFDLLLETVDLDDKTGHLFVVDIHFHHKNATSRQLSYNEIFPPIIEKHKIIDASERFVYQLIEQFSQSDNGIPRTYRCSRKAHATLFAKYFQPPYLEHIKFLTERAG